MNVKKQLSLCMITHNDEKVIEDCLCRLKGFADEIIVADIGSGDRTVELAKRTGASVYRVEWKSSFSEAKNFCLENANGKWVLFLQANETIPEDGLKELKSLLDNPTAEGYLLFTDYSSAGRSISSPVQFLRLFRNRREYRFEYRSFEMIPDSSICSVQNTRLTITHHHTPGLSWEMPLRTLLLRDDMAERPDDCYIQYIYGIGLLNEGNYAQSVPYFQKARAGVNYDFLFAPHLYKMLGWVLLYLKRYDECLEVLNEGIAAFSSYTDLIVLRGELYRQTKKYMDAFHDLEDCLKKSGQPAVLAPGPEISAPDIVEMLAGMHEELGNRRRALACYRQAYELNHAGHHLLYNIVELTPVKGRPAVLDGLLKTAVEKKDPEQLAAVLDVLCRRGEYEKALDSVKYLKSFPGEKERAETVEFRCRAALEDVNSFDDASSKNPDHGWFLPQRIEVCWLRGDWTKAGRLLEEMDGSENIELPKKALCHLVHEVLTGKAHHMGKSLTQEEFDSVCGLHDRLIWAGRDGGARALLPLLLEGRRGGDEYLRIAWPWAEKDDVQAVETIYRHIDDKNDRELFKQRMTGRFLADGNVRTARKFAEYGEALPLGAAGYVLWSYDFMGKAENWIEARKGVTAGPAAGAGPQKPLKPNEALLNFYRRLCAYYENEKSTPGACGEEPSDAELYGAVGAVYEKAGKKDESLLSYLRALQCDLLDGRAMEMAGKFFREDPERFGELLNGCPFQHNRTFADMARGLVRFQNGEFTGAMTFFSKIKEGEASYPTALAYKTVIALIGGFESSGSHPDGQAVPAEALPYLFRICQRFVLRRLDEGQRLYPYSEIINAEEKRVAVSSLML